MDQVPMKAARTGWQVVSAGTYYSLGIKADGTLWAWGYNGSGQLGNGSTVDAETPVRAGDAADKWQAVSAGENHALGIKADGTLWAWGYNGSGQLGNGSTVDAETPVRAGDAADKWQAVSAGMNHSLAIRRDGSLWAWGYNNFGQLGIGSTVSTGTPVQVGAGSDWQAVSAGMEHSLAIRRDGSLWAWGYNNFGQLGIGMIGSSTSTDTPVPARGATGGWKAVSAGDVHSLGIRSDGSLWAWGGNGDGRLGIGSTVSTGTPAPIGSAADKWQAVGAGGGHSLGIKRNGTLWAWGLNSNGQLGIGTSGPLSSTGTPILVGSAADGWKTISVGYRHSLGVKGDGSLWAWGLNSNGQLGDGTGGSRTDANNRSAPVLIGGPLLGTTSGARP